MHPETPLKAANAALARATRDAHRCARSSSVSRCCEEEEEEAEEEDPRVSEKTQASFGFPKDPPSGISATASFGFAPPPASPPPGPSFFG